MGEKFFDEVLVSMSDLRRMVMREQERKLKEQLRNVEFVFHTVDGSEPLAIGDIEMNGLVLMVRLYSPSDVSVLV